MVPEHAGTEDADIEERIRRVRDGVTRAPRAADGRIPEWLQDLEQMYDFFNSMAEVWDEFARTKMNMDSASEMYHAVASYIAPTDAEVRILDLGCGTGLELPQILARAPRARITGIDLAPKMLERLRTKFADHAGQIALILGSYLDVPLGRGEYDYVVSTLTVHHLPPATKVVLYRRIREALASGGVYIEGDLSSSEDEEREALQWFHQRVSPLPGGERGAWNFNLGLSVRTQTRLLREAGFARVDVANAWQGSAVIVGWP
jgi:tRNA (cmo5U34)-methyltransferase